MIYDTECQFLSTSRNLSAIQIVSRCSRRYFSIIILWKIPIPLIPGVVVSVFFSYSWPRLLSIFSPYSFRVPGLPIFGLVSSHSRPPCSLRIPALHGLLFVFSPCSFFLSLLISDPVSSPWPRLLFRAVSSPYSQYSLRISGLVSSQDTCPLRNISVFLASSPLILASSPLLNTRRIERERERRQGRENTENTVENTKKTGRIQREKTGKLTSWHLLSLVWSWRTPLYDGGKNWDLGIVRRHCRTMAQTASQIIASRITRISSTWTKRAKKSGSSYGYVLFSFRYWHTCCGYSFLYRGKNLSVYLADRAPSQRLTIHSFKPLFSSGE